VDALKKGMLLKPATESDLPQIAKWIEADCFHTNQPSTFWLTGSDCFFASKVEDDEGTLAYVRIEEEDNDYRIHTQFAPESEVIRSRIAKGIINFITTLQQIGKENGKERLITESINPELIAFLARLGFVPFEGDDYVLQLANS
jgi:hypothetical protein